MRPTGVAPKAEHLKTLRGLLLLLLTGALPAQETISSIRRACAEFDYRFRKPPAKFCLLPAENALPAIVVVMVKPRVLLAVSHCRRQIIWRYTAPESLVDIRVLKTGAGEGQLLVGLGTQLLALDNQGRERWQRKLVSVPPNVVHQLAVEDIGGDAEPEILVIGSREIEAYSAKGELLGRLPVGRLAADYEQFPQVAAGDLDGDGQAELVVQIGDDIRVFTGPDNAGFSAGETAVTEGLAVADTDGDDVPDTVFPQRGISSETARTRRQYLPQPVVWLVGLFGLVLLFILVIKLRRIPPDLPVPAPLPLSRRSAASLMGLCNEIISLDHIYAVKGNISGALTRLAEISRQFNLLDDPDIGKLGAQLEPAYSRFIYRLITEPETVNLFDLADAIRTRGLQGSEIRMEKLPREEFLKRMNQADWNGHWLVMIQDWEQPDIFDTFRLYRDQRIERYLEHWLTDNLRHSRTWSVVALEYTVNTFWNRKLTARLYNDGTGVIDPLRSHSNIVLQLEEASRAYGRFFEYCCAQDELQPWEKLTLRIWDFISILEAIYERQTGHAWPSRTGRPAES